MDRSIYEDGFSQDDAIALAPQLKALAQSPLWGIFEEVLKAAMIHGRETGFGDTPDRFLYYQGYVDGLKAASTLPAYIISQAQAAEQAKEKRGPKDRLPARPVTLDERVNVEGGDPSF